MKARNPFVYHVPVAPADFIGRERILSLIFGQLQSESRANIALYGPLGVGKTSLLNYISTPEVAERWGLDRGKYLLCLIDCQSLGDFTPDLFWRRLLRNVSRMVDGELEETVHQLMEQEEIDFEDIQDFLDDLEWSDRVLVVLLDEFECAVRTNTESAEQITRHFLGMLSSLGRRTPRVFTMVIATQQPLPVLGEDLDAWRGSPFPTIFISQEVPPFTPAEAEELFDQALAGTGVIFAPEERRFVYEQSDGHPALLQLAAAALFDAKVRGTAGKDLLEAVHLAVVNSRSNGAGLVPPLPSIRLNEDTGEVWINGRRVEGLSNKEFVLLRYLYENAGRVCLKNDIWEAVWPEYKEEGMEDYPIQKLVSRLRQKIEPNPSRPRYILTVWGRGYKFSE